MKVMIGTPSYDGKVDVRYADALFNTLKICPPDIQLFPVFMPGDALVQRARNDLLKIAIDASVDCLIFIDADIYWDTIDLFKLITSKKDFIGGLYRQKKEGQVLVYKEKENPEIDGDIIEILSIGFGFVKMSIECIKELWNEATQYNIGNESSARNVFDVVIENGALVSEDITVCNKWRALGGKVFADFSIHLGHVGTKVFILEELK